MSATVVGEKNETTLPADVVNAAGIRPQDRVDWTFEDGKIIGRKMAASPKANREYESELTVVNINGRYLLSRKLGREEILARIRADREGT